MDDVHGDFHIVWRCGPEGPGWWYGGCGDGLMILVVFPTLMIL